MPPTVLSGATVSDAGLIVGGSVGKAALGAPPTPAFTPAAIASLVLWIDFSQAGSVTTSAGAITSVNDLSTTGSVWAPTGSTNTVVGPKYQSGAVNGRNVALADGTVANVGLQSNKSLATILGSATSAELFLVGQCFADTDVCAMGTNWTTSGTNGDFLHYLDHIPYSGFASTNRFSGAATTAGLMNSVFTWAIRSGPGEFSIVINGTTNFTTASNTFSATSSLPQLMAASTGFVPTPHELVCEMVVYSRLLSGTEEATLRAYAHSKWLSP